MGLITYMGSLFLRLAPKETMGPEYLLCLDEMHPLNHFARASPYKWFATMFSQFPCSTAGPVQLDGRWTQRWTPKNGMLFKLRALSASCGVRSSMKANVPWTQHAETGRPGSTLSPTFTMASPRKSCNIEFVISGVVFPKNNSRLRLSAGTNQE